MLDVPLVMVSIIDGERQRVPGASGLPDPFAATREVPFELSLCVRVVESATALVIYDAANDEAIFVRGDRTVDYGTVARVMSRIKEAGFRKLSLVTETEAGG